MLRHLSHFCVVALCIFICIGALPVQEASQQKDVQAHYPHSVTVGVKGDFSTSRDPPMHKSSGRPAVANGHDHGLKASLHMRANATDDAERLTGTADFQEIIPEVGDYYQEEWVRDGRVVPAPAGKRFSDSDHPTMSRKRQKRVVRWAGDNEESSFNTDNPSQNSHEREGSGMLEHGMLDQSLAKKGRRSLLPICIWGSWRAWSSCSVSCTCVGCKTGYQRRTRGYSGPCSGVTAQTIGCPSWIPPCPIHCTWAPWDEWSGCSKTCASGKIDRFRSRSGPFHGGLPCWGKSREELSCNRFNCPVDCTLNQWASWSSCTLSCGAGKKRRSRTKNNELYGGKECSSALNEETSCNTFECPIDCYWKEWEDWTECPVSCGEGSRKERRRLQDPEANYGGVTCIGIGKISQPCNDVPCPQDCVWGHWNDWEACSHTCGLDGMMQSQRHKLFYVAHGGAECNGSSKRETQCNVRDCPVDCVWEEWQPWSNCSVPCGGGNTSTSRGRTHARFGGEECNGSDIMTEICNTEACTHDEKNKAILSQIQTTFYLGMMLVLGVC